MPETPSRPVVILSNRGPLAFRQDEEGQLVPRRGAGGLVSGLAPLVAGTETLWIAAAMSDADRDAADGGTVEADDLRVRLLDIDPATFRAAYDVVCNGTLWFCYHDLFDRSRRPRIDSRWREAWDAYVAVNVEFAEAAVELAPEGAAVLAQDYHLALVGALLRERRADLALVHFSHTPFCGPDGLRPLPEFAVRQLLGAMAANDACGFHTRRWATAFEACAREVLGRTPPTFVSPLAPDPDDLAAVVESEECATEGDRLDELLGDRRLILRVERVELSKNLLRGFHAYDDLLTRFPEWRQRVVFAAFGYPSREGLPEYLAYRQEVEGLVHRLNDKWATADWTPIVYEADDDFPRSVAALQRYDVLLVNPIRDGLNLVALEGPLTNRKDGVLVLSHEAGAWEHLGDAGALGVNPFDVTATADALGAALAMDTAERAERAASLRKAVGSRRPSDWLDDQLAAAG